MAIQQQLILDVIIHDKNNCIDVNAIKNYDIIRIKFVCETLLSNTHNASILIINITIWQ